jgi:predicted DNA-binding transcriptional regulator AlpA
MAEVKDKIFREDAHWTAPRFDRTGSVPQPIKLGSKITAWRAEDIRALIDRHECAADLNG